MKTGYRIAMASTLLLFLITGCAENSIYIDQGDTFSNHGSRFRVLDAKRYSQQYTCGDYKCYDDTVFILLEWSCVTPKSGECVVGGYEFSLYDTDKRQKTSNVTFNTELVNQFGVPEDSYNCCGLSRSGQVGKCICFSRSRVIAI